MFKYRGIFLDTLVVDTNTAYEYELNQWRDLRDTSEENYNYVRGDQWCRYEKQKAKLEKKGVPVLNLNLILPVVVLILGYQIQHRYDLKAYPIRQTPQFLADLITRLIKYTGIKSNLVHELSMTTIDALIANIGGYLCIDWTNEFDPLGDFRIRRESPFYHLRDSGNDHYDINYGEHHLRTKWLSKSNLLSMYSDRKSEIESFTRFKSKRNNWIDNISELYAKITKKKEPSQLDYVNEKDGLYRVVEMWEMERKEQKVLMNLKNDKMLELPENMLNKVGQLLADRPNWIITDLKRKELKVTSVLGGTELLVKKQNYDIQIGKFPFFNIFTHWIDGEPLSNVENLKDYQDEHNKRSGNILQILNSTANSGWWVKQMGDGEMSTKIEELIVGGSKFGFIGTYKGNQPPQKIDPNQLPHGHQYMDMASKEGIRETSMIGENIKGMQESAGESGRAIQKRLDQGSMALQSFFENVRNSYRLMGDYQVKAIPKKFTSERILDITVDEGNHESFTVNSSVIDDITKGDYDVTLSEVDTSPSSKTQKFMEMSAMAAAMPPELVYWPEVIRSSPYEGKDKMADYAEKIMGQQLEQQEEARQLQVEQADEESQLKMLKGVTEVKKVMNDEKKINTP